jgi:ATP-dependent DNA ligase
LHLRSRNDNDFSIRYPAVVQGLAKLPDETVIDGEVIALDELTPSWSGASAFNAPFRHAVRAPVWIPATIVV